MTVARENYETVYISKRYADFSVCSRFGHFPPGIAMNDREGSIFGRSRRTAIDFFLRFDRFFSHWGRVREQNAMRRLIACEK